MNNSLNILFLAHDDILVMDDPAWITSLEMARSNEGKITILRVVENKDVPAYGTLSNGVVEQIKDELMSRIRIQIYSQVENISGIEVTICIKSGIEFIEVIKESLRGDYDLITKVQEFYSNEFSSLDFHLLRKSKVPVWIFRHLHGRSYNSIVAAIDLSLEQTDEGRRINSRIMEFAKITADNFDVDFDIISCWSVNGENELYNNPFIKLIDTSVSEIIDLEESKYLGFMHEFKCKHGEDINIKLIKGNPIEEIPKYVNRNRYDILVMGTVARTGLSGYFIGNTAENIIKSISSSVITIKPENFETPITI